MPPSQDGDLGGWLGNVTFSLELTQLVVQEPEPEPTFAAVDEGLTAIAQYYEVCVRTLL